MKLADITKLGWPGAHPTLQAALGEDHHAVAVRADNAVCFLRLFLVPVKEHALPANPRYQPAY